MPLHEMSTYWITCDECDWSSPDSTNEAWPAEQLDKHIREEH